MGADLSRLRPQSLKPAVASKMNSPVFRPTAIKSPSGLNEADRALPTSILATIDWKKFNIISGKIYGD